MLWAQATAEHLTIYYAEERRKILTTATDVFQLINNGISSPSRQLQVWVRLLLDRAYGKSKLRPRLKVYLNPFSGKGSAVQLYRRYAEPIFAAAQCFVDLQETCHSGHAGQMAQEDPTIDSWDAIVCCSGDGLPYEVINGIALRGDAGHVLRNIPIIQLPGGSGNALCVNMFNTTSVSHAALYTLKGIRQPIDLMSVTQGDRRCLSFLSQSVGLLAECDLDTEHMRFLGGKRFALGFLQRLFKPPLYECDIAVQYPTMCHPTETHSGCFIDQENGRRKDGLPNLQFGSVSDSLSENWGLEHHPNLSLFFAGQFPFMDAKSKIFPEARPDDGLVDIILVDRGIGTRRFLQLFKRISMGDHLAMPEVHYRKVLAYRVTPARSRGAFSLDGERSDFRPFQVEVHPQLGTTLTKPPGIKEHQYNR